MTPREKFVAALDTMLSDYGHVIGRYGRDPVSNLKQSKDALLSLYDEAARPVAAGSCEWTHNEDESSWDTACDNKWMFTEGGPTDNGCKFCPYCGKALSAARGEGAGS